MYYQESTRILETIKDAQKILLSCHAHPDSDTVASATVLSSVLEGMGKQTKIICPDEIPDFLQFINGSKKIQKQRFENFDFEEWDLYIVCDTSGWKRLFMDTNFSAPTIPVVVIDNHTSNKGFGNIDLLDYETSSVCEMLFNVLRDWNIEIDTSMATSLLSGMLGDTGSFQFEVHKNTFSIADQLMKLGADRETAAYNLFNNLPLELIKFWGLVISKLTVEKNFAYVALNEEEYAPYLHIYGTRETAAQLIVSKIKGTTFGFIMTEDTSNNSSVSFRSRGGVDTSKIAVALGGGGHPGASGAWIRNTPFKEALNEVLSLCRSV